MNFGNIKITNKGLYWGLIITFAILYLCVGFVSTLHSITFFHLANSMGLAILLGLTYELGQASVLFGLLMTKNKDKFLPWALMILLTALQVTANVYASFRFMSTSGSNDWQYWQKSILFGVQASSPEMYKVIISWISGALLPVVALGMTALVAENIKMMTEGIEEKKEPEPIKEQKEAEEPEIQKQLDNIHTKANEIRAQFTSTIEKPIVVNLDKPAEPEATIPPEKLEEILENEVKRRLAEIQKAQTAPVSINETAAEVTSEIPEIDLKLETKEVKAEVFKLPTAVTVEDPVIDSVEILEEIKPEVEKLLNEGKKVIEKKPITKARGWHLKKEYEDSNGDIYEFGKFSHKKKKKPAPKKE